MDRINPSTLFPPPGGRFAHAVVVPTQSRLVFLAGQVAVDVDGNIVGQGDAVAQAGQCFVNLRLILEELGASPQDIAQLVIHVVGYQPEMLSAIDKAGDAAFNGDWPISATTLLGVVALGSPEFLVEVTATIVLPA